MFRVKICGITNVEDALAAVALGADAVGLNFFARSPRHVSTDAARQIVAALPPGVAKVGVFVNETAAFARELGHELGLDLLQLHGDETPDFLLQLVGRPVMRAFRLGYTGLEAVEAYLDHCRQRACLPRLVLLDALVEGEYGGTGQTTDWEAAARFATTHAMPGLVLAGGLTPENVAAAIHAVHPAAVDTASGVELSPGRKDHARMAAFIRAARHEFARLFAMEEGIGD